MKSKFFFILFLLFSLSDLAICGRGVCESESGETVYAIYITYSNTEYKSVCYLLSKRPVIKYLKDKVVVQAKGFDDLTISLSQGDHVNVEYELISTDVESISASRQKTEEGRVYRMDNRLVIVHNGVMYNINGTLYKK